MYYSGFFDEIIEKGYKNAKVEYVIGKRTEKGDFELELIAEIRGSLKMLKYLELHKEILKYIIETCNSKKEEKKEEEDSIFIIEPIPIWNPIIE
ncbi:MAG TPA: hypothetical protein EYH43_05415 [Persephonella sp.]|nr:hypothetical protein [Persephonella sp.]